MSLPIVIVAATLLALGLEQTLDAWPALVGQIALMVIGFVGLTAWTRSYAGRTSAAFAREGFTPFVGDFRDGLARWPVNGFPLLEAAPWAVSTAFHNADAGLRFFTGSVSSSSPHSMVSGAAILVTDAGYPVFSVEPVKKWTLFSTPGSSVVFRTDPAFAEEFSVQTANPRQLELLLGKQFMAQWRTMRTWRIEGHGDWVIVFAYQPTHHAKVAEYVELLTAVATALRADVTAQRHNSRARPLANVRTS